MKTQFDFGPPRRTLDNRTRLSWWFPRLPTEIPVPQTEIIPYPAGDLVKLCDGQEPSGFRPLVGRITEAGIRLGWPLFLRTDYLSGKHGWKNTCHVPSPDDVSKHIVRLVEESELADMMGFPTDRWIARELLLVSAPFTAFYGNMPIVKERRYFVNGASVICHHPYWPPAVFEGLSVSPSIVDWRASLDEMNDESADEIILLSDLSSTIGAAIGGAWSIDWLWSEQRGQWFLTDMAEAKSSYHWPGCSANVPGGSIAPTEPVESP